MFGFRIIFCGIVSWILKCMTKKSWLHKSIHLSGKTSKIVHKMLQDMMLGTLEKNRTVEYQDKVKLKATTSDKFSLKSIVKEKVNKLRLIDEFLKSRFTDPQSDKIDHEDEIKRNPYKYDIYEERDIITDTEMQSTTRKPQFITTSAPIETDGLDNNKETINKESPVVSEKDLNIEDPPEKQTSTTKIFGYHTKKQQLSASAYEDYWNEEKFYPSILNEIWELNLLLLEKIYNTFKRKADKVTNNFRKDNYAHLKPKVLEILERPPDDLLKRSKKRGGLDDIEEEQEINDQTVLISKDQRIDDTFDEEMAYAEQSGLHQSDRDFQRALREEIDKNGELVGDKDQLYDDENRRRELIDGMKIYDSGSVHSHETSTILDAEGIAFQEPGIALLGNDGSEDSMDEQDIVYYHKDDLTQFSKHLGINKVKRRDGNPLKLSEEDLSDNGSNNGSNLMVDPLFRSAISEVGEDPSETLGDNQQLFNGIDAGSGDRGINGPGGFNDTDGIFGPGGAMGLNISTRDKNGGYGPDGYRKGDKYGPADFYGPGGKKRRGGSGEDGEYEDGNGRKRKRKSKNRDKNSKLTQAQLDRLRAMNAIYGADAEQLGLSPRDKRYYDPRAIGKRKINKRDGNQSALPGSEGFGLKTGDLKSRKRSKKGRNAQDGSESVDNINTNRFNKLKINKPQREEGEYDKLKRKLQKFRKRKDLSFWMDYDSPYAEYLPHRFREWVPETKLGIELDGNKQAINAIDRAHELSRIYSRGLSPDEENGINRSPSEEKNAVLFSNQKQPSSLFRPNSNASIGIESVSKVSSGRPSREKSSSNKKKKNTGRIHERPPAHLSVYDNFLNPNDDRKESRDALNEETARSNNDFNIGPLYSDGIDHNINDEDPQYHKAADDDDIDFRPVAFNKFFAE